MLMQCTHIKANLSVTHACLFVAAMETKVFVQTEKTGPFMCQQINCFYFQMDPFPTFLGTWE